MFTDKSFEFTDVPRCDWPKGVCTYIDDPCPPDIPIDCRDEMHCPFSTNKCCCRYAIEPTLYIFLFFSFFFSFLNAHSFYYMYMSVCDAWKNIFTMCDTNYIGSLHIHVFSLFLVYLGWQRNIVYFLSLSVPRRR